MYTNCKKKEHPQLYILFFFFTRGKLKPNESHTKLIDAEYNVGTVTKVKFLWNNNVINPTLPKLGAAMVMVQDGEDGKTYVYVFCI